MNTKVDSVSRVPIVQHLLRAKARPTQWDAVRFKRHRTWQSLSWQEYYLRCEAFAAGLLELGIKRGEKVAIFSNTRMEWAVSDFGILGIGAVTIPVYQSYRPEELEFILNHSEARVLVVEDNAQLRKWESIAKKCRQVEFVICIENKNELPSGVQAWEDVVNLGAERVRRNPNEVQDLIGQVTLPDMATIVYTSGTTGEPKGAVLTHDQILSEVEDLTRAYPVSPMDATLSFLPYAHVLGRVELWLHAYLGFTMAFAESFERLKSNMRDIQPTVLIGVPRVFEKIHSSLMAELVVRPWRKKVFSWLSSSKLPLTRIALDRVVYSRLRNGFGGRLRFVVSGGAPLEASVSEFFHRAGVLLLEGYGLTETTAAICVNTPQSYQFGTVGRPLADVDIKLAADGEILVKSKKVFQSYYKNPEATQSAFQDGYFCTGDVGEFDANGFLRITDRKKDLIKTSGGKFVAPQKLEGLLKLNPLVSNVLIHGDRRKYVVALITLNVDPLKSMAENNKWSYRDLRALTQLPQVQEMVRQIVAETNSGLASFETIKNFTVLPDDFTVANGELTPSLKVKRRVLDEKYKDVIEELY